MPSQQSSFMGMRTALIFQLFMIEIDAASWGPSERPQPWMHAYSVPIRFTPCSVTVTPDALTSLLPCTCSGEGAPAIGEGVAVGMGVVVGAGVFVGAGVVVGTGLGVAAGAVTVKVAAGSVQ